LCLKDLFGGISRFNERTAIAFEGQSISYAELARQAAALAAALQQRGVKPGTPVALAMSNCIEFVVADQAIIRLGAAKVPINDMLSAGEVRYILTDSAPAVVIADEAMADRIRSTEEGQSDDILVIDRSDGSEWLAALSGGAEPLADVVIDDGDIAMILYTGGTTGRQKGVVHTQSGLALNMLSHVIEIGLGDDERCLVTTPLPHAAGLMVQAGLLKGATIHLTRRFDAEEAVRLIASDSITFTFMVPTMIYRLLDCAGAAAEGLRSLRTILYGAAPMSRARLEEGLAMLGPVFMQLYAQSEAPDFLTRLSREDHLIEDFAKLGSCGRRVLMMEVAVKDDAGGFVETGKVGEVVARGPYVMQGYHNLPEETAHALRDGWLHTGDVGWIDDEGYLFLVDRLKDMIISGGMNVYSTEVEQSLQRCCGVAHAAVVGVPHPDWGEAVVAFVVPTENGIDHDVLSAHCRRELAAYKRPKQFVEVTALPLTAYGKIDKKALRAMLSSGADTETPMPGLVP
jgi:fatty-acyl-CoA synthase/long-chain acyl-CoA synthetase